MVSTPDSGGEGQSAGLSHLDGFEFRPSTKKSATRWVVTLI